jgi:hypothetical protein
VHLSGIIIDERSKQAAVVCAENIAGVKKVHDHLCWIDPMPGCILSHREMSNWRKAGSPSFPSFAAFRGVL